MYKTGNAEDLTITIIEITTYCFTAYYLSVQLRLAYRCLRKTGSLANYASGARCSGHRHASSRALSAGAVASSHAHRCVEFA